MWQKPASSRCGRCRVFFYVSGWCSRVVVVHSAAPTTQLQYELVRHNCGNFICSDGLGEHRIRRRSVRDVILRSIIHSVGTAISRHISVRKAAGWPGGQQYQSFFCNFWGFSYESSSNAAIRIVSKAWTLHTDVPTVWCVGLFSSFC